MNLREYFEKYCINHKKFAQAAGLSQMTLSNVVNGKGVSAKTARQIEIATKGKVTLKDLVDFCQSQPKKVKKKSTQKEADLTCNNLVS